MLYTSIFDWLKPRVPIGLADPGLYPKPDVTLTPQPVNGVLPRYIPLPLGPGGIMPGITQPLEPVYRIMPVGEPVPMELMEPPLISPQTDLGAAPDLGEWFKKNRILVVGVIVALVLLFFFLRKGRR